MTIQGFQLRSVRDRLRVEAEPPGRSRLLVGCGTCGRSVGAMDVLEALRGQALALHLLVDVIATACDGQCHAAVQVTYWQSTALVARWSHVGVADVPLICQNVATSGGLPALRANEHLLGQQRELLDRAASIDPLALSDAMNQGAYAALDWALDQRPEDIINHVRQSGLLGQGGAYFPTWRKWQSCAAGIAPRYLVVNGEEGEPGVFKDRHLMEDNPHGLIEGALIAAYAIGAERVILYVNGRAGLSIHHIRHALAAAQGAGILGAALLGRNVACTVEIREGGGGYVLGEETALLESIEGRKALPRPRPPHATEQGLWGRPTVVNNVETISRIPLILNAVRQGHGAERLESIGRTKLVCLSGDVRRPGIYEVPFGRTLRDLLMDMAGGPRRHHPLQAVLLGGPSGRLVPAHSFDLALAPSDSEVSLGSGNVVAIDAGRSLLEIVRDLAQFNAEESCGKCTPCREGGRLLAERLSALSINDVESVGTELLELSEIIRQTSLCGLGRMSSNPVESGLPLLELR